MHRLKPFLFLALLSLALFPAPATKAQQGGDFDYYVLSLSWSPSYCADDARKGRDTLQCFSQRSYGFVLHGLWPQYERGYPTHCDTSFRAPSDKLVEQMLKFSPSRNLIQHEWRKHGSCTGLKPLDYYRQAVKSFKRIHPPAQLANLQRPLLLRAADIVSAFRKANPDLPQNSIFVTCKRRKLREVRICLNKDGTPRRCSKDALKGSCPSRGKLRILALR